MPERIVPGPVSNMRDNCEAVCIHTKKIYDSCREEDITSYKIKIFKSYKGLTTFSQKKNRPG